MPSRHSRLQPDPVDARVNPPQPFHVLSHAEPLAAPPWHDVLGGWRVCPRRVRIQNKPHFPSARPGFQRFLSRDCRPDLLVPLDEHQSFQSILFGKSLNRCLPMLPRSARQIAGNPRVEHPVRPVGHDVDPTTPHRSTSSARKPRNAVVPPAVMPGLDPGIHGVRLVLAVPGWHCCAPLRKAGGGGRRVDARVKPWHDVVGVGVAASATNRRPGFQRFLPPGQIAGNRRVEHPVKPRNAVMPGLDPGIHGVRLVLAVPGWHCCAPLRKAGGGGRRVDATVKPWHDVVGVGVAASATSRRPGFQRFLPPGQIAGNRRVEHPVKPRNAVMPGLDPGIHGVRFVLAVPGWQCCVPLRKAGGAWRRVDARVKPWHDVVRVGVAASVASKRAGFQRFLPPGQIAGNPSVQQAWHDGLEQP